MADANANPTGLTPVIGFDQNHLVYPTTAGLGNPFLDFRFVSDHTNIFTFFDATWTLYKDNGSPTPDVVGACPQVVSPTTSDDIYYVAKSDADAAIAAAGTGTLTAPAFRITAYPQDVTFSFVSVSFYAAGDITANDLGVGLGGSVGLTTANQLLIYGTPGVFPVTAKWDFLT